MAPRRTFTITALNLTTPFIYAEMQNFTEHLRAVFTLILSSVVLSVTMLSVVVLSVIMLCVAAPILFLFFRKI
jgi:hypothetical protein